MTCPVPVISKLVPLLLGCYSGYAEGINDAGWVVGNCYDSNDSSNVSHPFVYNGSKTIDLNTQVVGWVLFGHRHQQFGSDCCKWMAAERGR